jgi:hypothetical protein
VSPVRTDRAVTEDLVAEVRERFRRALHDTNTSAALLGALIGRDGSWVERWYTNVHVPLYVLAHRRVPLALRLRLIADMLALAGDADGQRASVETGTAMLIAIASECLAVAGRVLADQCVDEGERRELRPLVARLRDRCDRWLRDHGGERARSEVAS